MNRANFTNRAVMRRNPRFTRMIRLVTATATVGAALVLPFSVAASASTATVSVGGYPTGVAVNSTTNTIYVANGSDNTVSVINGSTNTVTATVSVGGHPSAVAVNATTNTIYVANFLDNTVSVISFAPPTTPSISNLPTSASYSGSFTPTVVTTGDGTTSVTSSTTSVCTVAAVSGLVSFVGTGTCTLKAHVAQGANYASADGSDQSFTVAAVKPSAPGTPVLTDNHGSISLSWSAPTNPGDATVTYVVKELTNQGTWKLVAKGLTSPTYTYQGTAGQNRYSFAVVAVNSAGKSAQSGVGTLQATIAKPSAPGTPTLTDNHGSISLSWSAPTNAGGDTVTYKVVELTNGGSWSQVATGLTSPTYTYQGTTPKNSYWFAIFAVNSAGQTRSVPSHLTAS